MKTLTLIHHSHTDVGYTSAQTTVRRHHVGFIRQALAYAWLMANYWETNFAAGLGGFHSFRFSVFPPSPADPQQAVQQLRAANAGLVCFRVGDEI